MKRLTQAESLAIYQLLNAHPPMTMVVSPAVIFNIIGQCQLALRHPSNHGPSAQTARQWIEQVARYLDGLVPGTYDLVQMGFDGRFDRPVEDDAGEAPLTPGPRAFLLRFAEPLEGEERDKP